MNFCHAYGIMPEEAGINLGEWHVWQSRLCKEIQSEQ